jgi:hypothetical protein
VGALGTGAGVGVELGADADAEGVDVDVDVEEAFVQLGPLKEGLDPGGLICCAPGVAGGLGGGSKEEGFVPEDEEDEAFAVAAAPNIEPRLPSPPSGLEDLAPPPLPPLFIPSLF